jgi:hypothetical protein
MKIVVLTALIFLLAGAFIVSADVIPIPIDQCKNLYWFDNENKSCGQGQFCGAYMYQGLRTFENKTACENAANNLIGCSKDSDCVLRDEPYCCGDKVEYVKDCYPKNEEPLNVSCSSSNPCPGLLQVDYCKCENNTCVGKSGTDSSCKNLYWIDNDNKSCGQKEFCGAYMYYGLFTFENETACQQYVLASSGSDTDNLDNCTSDYECIAPSCPTCQQPKCINGKCLFNNSDSNCRNLYWIDNENKSCGQKEFCGAYAYYGLYTYESKVQCEKALGINKTKSCPTNSGDENGKCMFNLSN